MPCGACPPPSPAQKPLPKRPANTTVTARAETAAEEAKLRDMYQGWQVTRQPLGTAVILTFRA